jgi:hypothetical protein
MRHRIARAALIFYFVTLFAASLAMCACPGFYAVMAGLAAVALICGSRGQRLLAAVLMIVASTAFVMMYRHEQESAAQAQRFQEQIGHQRAGP